METDNHKSAKAVVAESLQERGYTTTLEVDLPSTTDARVRADVLGERDSYRVVVEVGGVSGGKIARLEQFVDEVIHVPYESGTTLTPVDGAFHGVFKRAVRDVHGAKRTKSELHNAMLDYLNDLPDEVVEYAVGRSDFDSVDEMESFVESGDPHRLTADYVRDAVSSELR